MTEQDPTVPFHSDDPAETLHVGQDSHAEQSSVQMVGPYRILKELGRGGQGVVFLAEDPRLGRKVALKVLTAWSQASSSVIARFEREAAIASKLDHPGICTVYETGTAHSAPYMVMRHVEGMSFSDRIATESSENTAESTLALDLEKRSADHPEEKAAGNASSIATHVTFDAIKSVIDIVEKVARALHAAHEVGVIHRDIKPGNIMITKDSEPVILDFGLARDSDSDHQTLTQTGDVFGTPAYMAPEQLSTTGGQVDRRADVWALGVTLFEGLALQRPFLAPTRDGLYQAILHMDPTDIRRLNSAVPKDLRIIIETALEKDRDRRYQTALDLAEDLRRFRAKEPIHAKPASPALRLLRWAQRNRGVAAALVLVILSLSGGLISSIREKARTAEALNRVKQEQTATKNALNETETERVKTAMALEHVQAVRDFLNDDVLGQVSPEQGGKDVLVRDLLDRASQTIEGKFKSSPRIEADIQNTIGGVYLDLGDFEVAARHYSRAVDLREEHAGPEHPDTLTSLNNLGLVREKQGRFDQALRLYERALASQRQHLGEEHPNTLTSTNNLAVLQQKRGALKTALRLFEKTLEVRRRVLGEEHPNTLISMGNLALLLEQQGRVDRALPLFQQTLDLQRQILGDEHPNTLISLQNLAKLYKARGETKRSLELYLESLAAMRRVLGEEHPGTLNAMNNLAVLYYTTGKTELARPLYEKTLKIQRKRLGEEHPSTLASMNNLALLYKREKKYDLAAPLQLQALTTRRRLLGDNHPDTWTSLTNMASLYYTRKDFKSALPLYEAVLDSKREVLGVDDPATLWCMVNFGSCLVKLKSYAEAESILLDAYERAARVRGSMHSQTTSVAKWLAHLHKQKGELEKAAAWKMRQAK